MMILKKRTKQYHFTVEGETEKWYLENLQMLINNSSNNTFNVKFDIKIEKSILKRVKSLPVIYPIELFHICDYESTDILHTTQFDNLLTNLKKVKGTRKDINCKLGYSNFTFELWLLLHKIDCFSPVQHRDKYLKLINKAYTKNFQFIKDYKGENEFKNLLGEITLQDVINAINRADKIRDAHRINGDVISGDNAFKYYKNNPDLTVHECVEKILIDCKIITKRKQQ